MLLGNKIKKIRELKNFTQEYVAEQLGMSQSGYSKLEADETDVSLSRIEQIATTLGLTINDLLNFDEKVVFNISNNQTDKGTNGVIFNNGLSESEKKLYDEKVAQLEKEVDYLKSVIDKLLVKDI
jgi:transcriptional regulator with XRE-family HTH domain